MIKRLLVLTTFSVSVFATTSSDTNFINKVYNDVLDRPVDPGGLSVGLAYLATPGNTPQGYAFAILSSLEYRTDLVDSYYEAYLSRTSAGDPGATGFVTFLGSGGTDQQVQSIITGSLEYFGDHSSDNTQFIDALYFDLLGRTPSGGEVTTDLGILGSNTRAQLATAVLASSEYDTRLVNLYYLAYLNRPADSGASGFVTELQSSVTDEVVQSQIIGSAEYYSLAQVTPEPASFFLAGLGIVIVGLRIRSRRSRL
jgi:PEP-CTERM motif